MLHSAKIPLDIKLCDLHLFKGKKIKRGEGIPIFQNYTRYDCTCTALQKHCLTKKIFFIDNIYQLFCKK